MFVVVVVVKNQTKVVFKNVRKEMKPNLLKLKWHWNRRGDQNIQKKADLL